MYKLIDVKRKLYLESNDLNKLHSIFNNECVKGILYKNDSYNDWELIKYVGLSGSEASEILNTIQTQSFELVILKEGNRFIVKHNIKNSTCYEFDRKTFILNNICYVIDDNFIYTYEQFCKLYSNNKFKVVF